MRTSICERDTRLSRDTRADSQLVANPKSKCGTPAARASGMSKLCLLVLVVGCGKAAPPAAGAGSYSVVARQPEALHPAPDLRAVLPELACDRGQVASVAIDRRDE